MANVIHGVLFKMLYTTHSDFCRHLQADLQPASTAVPLFTAVLNQICCDDACSVLCWGFCCFSPLFPLSMSEHEMGCRFPSRAKCGNNNLILTETGLCLSHALLFEWHRYSVGEVLTLALLPGIVEDDCMPLCVTANLSVCILAETG